MNEHTPGPWELTKSTGNIIVIKKKGYVQKICALEIGLQAQFGPIRMLPETEANAYLIAAAPDLLATCERARNVMEQPAVINNLPNPFGDWVTVVLAELNAAIAKAENGSE